MKLYCIIEIEYIKFLGVKMTIDEIVYNRSFDIPVENRKSVGELIKKIREEKKMTLADISDKSKVGLSDLHKIEYGTKIKINPFQLKAIGIALNIDYKIFYKIVGFLDDEDFNSNRDDTLIKTELKNFKTELIENFLETSKGKVSEANLKMVLDILSNLSDDKINSWVSYGKFLLNDIK